MADLKRSLFAQIYHLTSKTTQDFRPKILNFFFFLLLGPHPWSGLPSSKYLDPPLIVYFAFGFFFLYFGLGINLIILNLFRQTAVYSP